MLTDLLYRLRAIFRRKAVESDLNEELRFHFDSEVEKYMRQGIDAAKKPGAAHASLSAATSKSRKTAAKPAAPASSKLHCRISATRSASFAAIPDSPLSSSSLSP